MLYNSTLERFCAGTNMTPAALADYLNPHRIVRRTEQLRRLWGTLEVMYWQAVRVCERANSYRNFRVGCAVYAFQEDASTYQNRWRFFYGMNTKVGENNRPVCAEPIAISAAYAAGCTEILGMVVVGKPRAGENGDIDAYSTLHPCHECRALMKEHPLMKRHTRIITATPPEPDLEFQQEMHTLVQLLELYGEAV